MDTPDQLTVPDWTSDGFSVSATNMVGLETGVQLARGVSPGLDTRVSFTLHTLGGLVPEVAIMIHFEVLIKREDQYYCMFGTFQKNAFSMHYA
jgi:hypothetical protein